MLTTIIAVTLASYLEVWPSRGSWDISKYDVRCLAGQSYEGAGETRLTLSVELDGTSRLIAVNQNWTTVEGVDYPEVTVLIDDTPYRGGIARGVKSSFSAGSGLLVEMPSEFLSDFATGSSLKITNGDILVDSLSLNGSAIAVTSLRQCINAVRAEHRQAENQRQRLAHIPVDPFANAQASIKPLISPEQFQVQWTRPPRPTERDFPQRALDRGVGGSATVECMLTPSGRAEQCRVLTETPSGMGFGAAALRIVQRGQLSPRTVYGAAEGQRFIHTQEFNLD